ncbi:MAG: T9SS type A sorting domain-containing protein [Flavobacteriales bacterium]|nr:T9SS type A sorting domain-containing protein [Flavobacteriales bacterium]MCB9193770.1 T9SS type A sorting domain-containing protein [Flavobacteriales bacterium]
MERTCTLLACVVVAGIANAQWTNDTLQNTTIRDAAQQPAVTPLMCDGPNGSTYVSWFETQGGQYVLKMQRLDADGYLQWQSDGLLISDHPQNSALFRYDLATDIDGNAIVAFQDERSGQLDIVAYKIGPDGTFLWGADGIELTAPSSTQGLSPVIGVLTNNDAVIAWNANSANGSWVALQRIDPMGNVEWTVPHTITGNFNYTRPKVVPTSSGGYILHYVQESGGGFPPLSTMFAQRSDAMDQSIWGPVQVSSRTIPFFFFPEPVGDGHDGYYVAFQTSNPIIPSESDTYLQRVRGNGTTWSTEGTELLTGTTTHRFPAGAGLIDDAHGVLVSLKVTDQAQSSSGISVQRSDTAGTVQLGPNGTEVLPVSANYYDPTDMATTTDGGILIYREGAQSDGRIRAVRVATNGATVWAPAIRTLSSVPANKDDIACGGLRNDQLVTVWSDDRTNDGIFAQDLTGSGSIGPVGITQFHEATELMHLVTDPADHPEIVPSDPRSVLDLTLFDASGRRVLQARIRGRSRMDGWDVPTGMYLIRAVTDHESTTLRWCRP